MDLETGLESHYCKPLQIAVTQFNFDILDTAENEIQEALARGQSIKPILLGIQQDAANDRAVRALAQLFPLILESRQPRRMITQLQWICGMQPENGATLRTLAAKFHITHEAFRLGALSVARKIGLSPSSACRTPTHQQFKRTKP